MIWLDGWIVIDLDKKKFYHSWVQSRNIRKNAYGRRGFVNFIILAKPNKTTTFCFTVTLLSKEQGRLNSPFGLDQVSLKNAFPWQYQHSTQF